MQTKYKIILGSQSPRRRELLKGLNIDFEVKTIEGSDERFLEGLAAEAVAEYLAKQKADALSQSVAADTLLITADTIVTLDNKVYGKPKDRSEARTMLRELSGKTHKVITGVCITTAKTQTLFSTTTKVTFGSLTDSEIDYYIEKYLPLDKAGSYGIQEWIGFIGVESIEGSFYNVMGLPVQRIYKVLKNLKAI